MSETSTKARNVTRRGFLKGTAAAGTLAALAGGPILGALKQGRARAGAGHAETVVATSCINCPAVCPLKVTVQEGRAVRVEGNPLSKVTGGAICPKAHLGIQNLYDPDRIKGPMKRTNPKKGLDEDPKWVPVSWDEALGTIAEKLNKLREKGEAHKFLLIRGRYMISDADLLYTRFAKTYGTPNAVSHSALCAEGDKIGKWMAIGQYKYSAYDLEKANYLLMFGMSPLESHRPTARLQRMWGYMRQERGKRVKTVVIDPRLSATANVADEWHPINPGTDAALALAIAHVILTEGLWDKSFVGDFEKGGAFKSGQALDEKDFKENMTLGLIKWWNLVLKDFTPAKAEKETGISAAHITRIAREFATTKPAIAWRARGACAWGNNGAYNSYSIFALNALVGSYDVPGGVLVQGSAPMGKVPDAPSDDLGKKSGAMPRLDLKGTKLYPKADVVSNQVADSILKGEPYPVEVVMSWMANWNHSAPGSKRWTQALAKVPFYVAITPFASEMAALADILLPTPTWMEKWAYETAPDAGGIAETRIKQPVVKAMFDTRQTAQITFDLAKKMGGIMAKTFDGIGDTPEGFVKMVMSQATNWDEFKKNGVLVGSAYKYGDHEKRLLTPSKKFEFVSGNLKATLDKLKMEDADYAKINLKARGDLLLVPHYEEPRFLGDKKDFPLVLATYKPALNSEGRSANNTWAQEILQPMIDEGWQNFAELNPATAAKYGIADGDMVEVESPFGKIQLKAKVWPGVHPESLLTAFGQGHTHYGRNAKGRGANANEITGVDYDHLSGMAAYYNTRVRVRKV